MTDAINFYWFLQLKLYLQYVAEAETKAYTPR